MKLSTVKLMVESACGKNGYRTPDDYDQTGNDVTVTWPLADGDKDGKATTRRFKLKFNGDNNINGEEVETKQNNGDPVNKEGRLTFGFAVGGGCDIGEFVPLILSADSVKSLLSAK